MAMSMAMVMMVMVMVMAMVQHSLHYCSWCCWLSYALHSFSSDVFCSYDVHYMCYAFHVCVYDFVFSC
jgi:hypothetical protein